MRIIFNVHKKETNMALGLLVEYDAATSFSGYRRSAKKNHLRLDDLFFESETCQVSCLTTKSV